MSICMCVFMCVRLNDSDKDIQHKTIWVTLSTCCTYQKYTTNSQKHENIYSTMLCNVCDLTLKNEFQTHCC